MNDQQKAATQLAAWLQEWQTDELLADRDTAEAPRVPADALEPVPGDRSAACRQIRLMAPCSTRTSMRLQYLAILQEPQPGVLLVAPFSPFSVPATPGELSLQGGPAGRSVLSLWNACAFPARQLSRLSWFVQDLNETDTHDALRIWQSISDDTVPPDDLRDRVGPPVTHPEDPRHQYLAAQQLRMDDIRHTDGSAGSAGFLRFVPWQERLADVRLRQAAEDEALYAARAQWNIPALGCQLRMTQASTQSPCDVRVCDTEGRPLGLLDGGCVLCRLESVPLRNGSAQLPSNTLADGFVVLDRDDEPLLLERA